MQPSSFLDNIAQQPEFLSAVSRSNIESRINCATSKRLSSLVNEQYFSPYYQHWHIDVELHNSPYFALFHRIW